MGIRVPPSARYEQVGRLAQETVELPQLITMVSDGSDGTEHPLCHLAMLEGTGRGENLFLDLRRKPQHAHDLCHSGSADPLLTGDFGLSGDLT